MDEDRGSDILEGLNQEMVDRSVNVFLIQHTGAKKDDVLDIGDSSETFFIHGATQDNNHIHGEVGIAPSCKAYIAWVVAVQEESVKYGIIIGTTRYMTMDMYWSDRRDRAVKYS